MAVKDCSVSMCTCLCTCRCLLDHTHSRFGFFDLDSPPSQVHAVPDIATEVPPAMAFQCKLRAGPLLEPELDLFPLWKAAAVGFVVHPRRPGQTLQIIKNRNASDASGFLQDPARPKDQLSPGDRKADASSIQQCKHTAMDGQCSVRPCNTRHTENWTCLYLHTF